ncbi:GHMP kinase [Fulvimarina endophytica]|uniref:GHMP kinase n=1 Tax=Fulvimarina endophytica TaxID=2293836 RepID=A0A371X1A7_9HYPH|nr:beta-ribofuranosylaminobenzene 5'-phosphate synthase family protein [Fulvimarina endophytica]RFC63018.1 GHMP kinase [Fulvimarina endophytica]
MQDDFVHVSAPARLHLGFLDPGANFGRRFGGIGLAINAPATSISLRRAPTTVILGHGSERAGAYLRTLADHLGLDGGYRLEVETVIPAHTGLGSGTQMALAVSTALRTLEGLPDDVPGDAARLGRGQRSGLGAAFLSRGGLAVDGGKGAEDAPPPLISRFDFPEAWRAILVLATDLSGIHGSEEIEAFARLPVFPKEAAGEVSALTLMQVLPGLAERDLATFGAGLTRIQEIVGSHFASAQGGVFSNPKVADLMAALAAEGAHGIGQSSWGPTGFAFAESEAEAARLVERVRSLAAETGLELKIVKGRNAGASIERRGTRIVSRPEAGNAKRF